MKTWLVEGTEVETCCAYTETEYLEHRLPALDADSLFIVANKGLYEQMLFLGYHCNHLKTLGYGNFYEMYSVWFGDTVQNEQEMLETLYLGLFKEQELSVYILKTGVFFTWFRITSAGKLEIGGGLQFSKALSICTVGQFMKQLSRQMAKSGFSLRKLHWCVWNESDMPSLFKSYISDYIVLNWNRKTNQPWVRQSAGQTYKDIYAVLNLEYTKANITAQMFISLLFNTADKTGFKLTEDGVEWQKSSSGSLNYFSIRDKDDSISKRQLGAGIVLDCEGTAGGLEAGFRECGGVVFSEYTDCILAYQQFNTDSVLAFETLKSAVELEVECTHQKKVHSVYIYTYGTSDELMVKGELRKRLGDTSNLYKTFGVHFVFVDVIPMISDYLIEFEYISDLSHPKKLTEVASLLGVTAEKAHQALSDAKTLFNILAKMKRDGYFAGRSIYSVNGEPYSQRRG